MRNTNNKNPKYITIYFSLPFYPVEKKTFFYSGHIALGIGSYIYQIYNPKLLKSNFFVSIMPRDYWLYKDMRIWIDKDKKSKTFKYVSLYGKSEIKRTKVFYINIYVSSFKLKKYQNYFINLEDKYQKGKIKFNILQNNCVNLINPIFYEEGVMKKGLFDFIPSVVYKKIIKKCFNKKRKFSAGIIKSQMINQFKLHKFCLGLFTLSPEKYLLNWLKNKLF